MGWGKAGPGVGELRCWLAAWRGVSGREWPEWCCAKVAFDLPERGGRAQRASW